MTPSLSALCRLYGVETHYRDIAGRIQKAHPEALRRVLASLRGAERRSNLAFRDKIAAAPSGFRDDGCCKAYRRSGRRSWGLFLPLHALHSSRSRGAGDFSDLAAWSRWIGALGGNWAGTLPLLPTYLDRPFDPSPYAPVSRLFWGEFWLDLTRSPEWKRSPAARRLAPKVGAAGPWVDYRSLMKKKRAALTEMSRVFASGAGSRFRRFERFLRENPEVKEYARFRADQEGRDSVLYYEYAQWLAQEQIDALARVCTPAGVRLALDLPLGVHPSGYDAWKYRHLFAEGMSVGAPPDAFFSKGQNWGFAPLHPQRIREEGCRYFAACLRHQMRVAGLLRIDHVMGLHRLFWIPNGMPASMGVYVRYPARELYSVVCRESRRYRCEVVGEDLGIVPGPVRAAMRRHGFHRMYILPFESTLNPARAFRAPPAGSVAGLNTHDMPPFENFWRAKNAPRKIWISALRKQGWISASRPSGREVLDGLLRMLAAGPTRILMISLEDLWSERRPQNVPGTFQERPNWRGRARFSRERFSGRKQVLETLREIDHLRRMGGKRR